MGKIRVRTLGLTEEEEKQKTQAKARKEAKKAQKTAKVPGLKGGERLVSMAPSEEELANLPVPPLEEETRKVEETKPEVEKKVKVKRAPKKHGQKYQKTLKLVDKNRLYPLDEALSLVKKTSFTSFDGSVEVHLNTSEKGLSGNVQFPYETGKKFEIAIVNDQILAEIQEGKINFDVLIATPEFMPKLAKVAKILGPKGLMPNPKSGTVTNEPEKLAEKLKGSRRFKSELQAPLIHSVIGKVSFPEKHLKDNLQALVSSIGQSKIEKITLSSTMGPGIKVDPKSL